VKPDVYARRVRIVNLMSEGFEPLEIIKFIVGEFGISERQAWRDWSSRMEWMREVVMDEGAEIFLFGLLANFMFVRRELWKVLDETKNDGLKVRILRTLLDLVFKEFELRQSLGQFPYVKKPRR